MLRCTPLPLGLPSSAQPLQWQIEREPHNAVILNSTEDSAIPMFSFFFFLLFLVAVPCRVVVRIGAEQQWCGFDAWISPGTLSDNTLITLRIQHCRTEPTQSTTSTNAKKRDFLWLVGVAPFSFLVATLLPLALTTSSGNGWILPAHSIRHPPQVPKSSIFLWISPVESVSPLCVLTRLALYLDKGLVLKAPAAPRSNIFCVSAHLPPHSPLVAVPAASFPLKNSTSKFWQGFALPLRPKFPVSRERERESPREAVFWVGHLNRHPDPESHISLGRSHPLTQNKHHGPLM